MSYLVLARKYRPQKFEHVVGQNHVTRTLTNAISANRVAHAILFSGPRGTGKTTIARILAKAINCHEGPSSTPCNKCRSCKEITSGSAADVFEIDGASNNGVDQIRDLRENVKYMPQHSKYKIYIIDEVHMLSIAAFNALLKTLEEPPAHVMFFFATTEPHKIPVTILSRCQRHDLKRIRLETIIDHMTSLCKKENVKITEESLNLIAREAGGCMRDALSLLDQVLGCSQDEIDPGSVADILGVTDRKVIFEISEAILKKDIPNFLFILDEVYNGGQDLKKIYADLIEHFRNLLVVRIGEKKNSLVNIPAHEIELIKAQVQNVSEIHLSQMLDSFFREESMIRFSSHPKVAIEMAVIKMIQIRPAVSVETLLEKLDLLRNEFQKTGPEFLTQLHDRQNTALHTIEENAIERNSTHPNPEFPSEREPEIISPSPLIPEEYINNNELKTGKGEKASSPIDAKHQIKTGTPKIIPDDPERAWQMLRSEISKTIPSMAAPLSNSTMTGFTDQEISIAITDSQFNINRINKKKDALTKVCCDFFEKTIKLNIDMKLNTEHDKKHEISQENRLKKEAVRHPLVTDAIEIFNGNVVDVKLL